jgi:phosphoribosylglycinamide formyltransferase-1
VSSAPKRVALLISGGGSNMLALCQDMVGDHAARPALVLANSLDSCGLVKAQALGIATQMIDRKSFGTDRAAFELKLTQVLKKVNPDIICLAGFMLILSSAFIHQFEGRMLNIHPSLLPKYPGLDTHARALAAGDEKAGCSVHLVTPELDSGPILGQKSVPILPQDTPEILAARVLVAEHQLYPKILRAFAVGPVPAPSVCT